MSIRIMLLVVGLIWGTAVQGIQAQNQKNSSWMVPQDAEAFVYKSVSGVDLRAVVFRPPSKAGVGPRPAIVCFFGGGWRTGTPVQFYQQCRYLASRGMLAVSAEYRVSSRHQARVIDCVSDANAAMRWLRSHAAMFNVDPRRIAAAGGSAGGHLAAAVAALPDLKPGGRPDALVLFNPALDLRPIAFGVSGTDPKSRERQRRYGAPAEDLSPHLHIHQRMPPTLILHGRADTLIPYSQPLAFQKKMREFQRRCDLAGYAGASHGFFNYGRQQNRYFAETMQRVDRFLVSLGYLDGSASVQKFLTSQPR